MKKRWSDLPAVYRRFGTAFCSPLRIDNPTRWKLSPMRVVVGGAAPSLALVQEARGNMGWNFEQGWGLTESSPQATTSQLKAHMQNWPEEKKCEVKAQAGIPVPFVREKGGERRGRRFHGTDKPWARSATARALGSSEAITIWLRKMTNGRKTDGFGPATSEQ